MCSTEYEFLPGLNLDAVAEALKNLVALDVVQ